MKGYRVVPSALTGIIKAPPSKSLAHRALICAALSGEECFVSNVGVSDDVKATISCLSKLGVMFTVDGNGLLVNGKNLKKGKECGPIEFNCKESGATLRFMIPIAAALGIDASFYGTGNLPNRSVDEYFKLLPKRGVQAFKKGKEIISISGQLTGDDFNVSTGISSQFLSGLMLALPLLDSPSVITLNEPIHSRDYVVLTSDIQSHFGVKPVIDKSNLKVTVPSGKYLPADYKIEGDFSSAAFYLTAGALGHGVTVEGLSDSSHQGERCIVKILSSCGAKITQSESFVKVTGSPILSPIRVDCSDIPDLVPILAVLACFVDGKSVLENCGELYYKESDRFHAICDALTAFGADIEALGGNIVVRGHGWLDGGETHDYGDHRVAMALSIAAAFSDHDSLIETDNTVNKSYPAFYSDFVKLGGRHTKIN